MEFNALNERYCGEILSLLENPDVQMIRIWGNSIMSFIVKTTPKQMRNGAVYSWSIKYWDYDEHGVKQDWKRCTQRFNNTDGFPRYFYHSMTFMHEMMTFWEIRKQTIQHIEVPWGASPNFNQKLHNALKEWVPQEGMQC